MIHLIEAPDLVDVNDLINGLMKAFHHARREMRQGLAALCRDIKKRIPDYQTPPRKHLAFPSDVVWDIRTLLEEQWRQTEFLNPPIADNVPALIHQTSALTAADKTSHARRQGLRFSGSHTFTDLKSCIANHTDLLYRSVLIPSGGIRINALDFSACFRFWQELWAKHGIAGLTIAYLIWQTYFEKIIDRTQVQQAERLGNHEQVQASEELADVLSVFRDEAQRGRVQAGLILTGKLCYRRDIDENELSKEVHAQVMDYLAPTLWGALYTFGSEELRTRIDTTDIARVASQCIDDSELLSLILLFGQLNWKQVEQVMGTGLATRKTVAQILGSSLAVKRMAASSLVISKNLQKAQNHGLVPDDLKATLVRYAYPDKTVEKVWQKAVAIGD